MSETTAVGATTNASSGGRLPMAGVAVTGAAVVTNGMAYLVPVLGARHLPPGDLSALATAVALVAIASVAGMGLQMAVAVHRVRHPGASTTRVTLLTTAVTGGVLVAATPLIVTALRLSTGLAALLAAITVAIVLASKWLGELQGDQRFLRLALGMAVLAVGRYGGIIAGLAARPVLSNLMAGVQIAMTQPIRLYDSVVVEGESGMIEEIGSTFVTVKLWDLRRMVVPLTYFIERPFQNWTREGPSSLIGSVMLYVDFTAPVAIIRERFLDILKQSTGWDGKTVALQVTDFKEGTIELRCLMSARTAGETFNLRCEVREKLIDFLQKEYPEALPRTRQITLKETGYSEQAPQQSSVTPRPAARR